MYRFFFKGFEKELETACEMSEINIEDGKELIDCYFKALDYLIDDERVPDLAIEALGTMSFDEKKVDRVLNNKNPHLKELDGHKRKRLTLLMDLITKRRELEKDESLGKDGSGGVGFWWSFVPKKYLDKVLKIKDAEE